MFRYIISVDGPDHEAITTAISGEACYNPAVWKYQPLGRAADFHHPSSIMASLAYTCLQVMSRFPTCNRLTLTQTPGKQTAWLGPVNQIEIRGETITSMHLPHAMVNEDWPDMPDACRLLAQELKQHPFADDIAMVRFLNQRNET